jgi:hypothetical protein
MALMVRALKWPRPEVCGRHTRMAGRPDATGFRSTAGSIRRCADGWLPRVRQDFMLEALPPCYERLRIFRGSAAVKTQRPIISDDEHVVLKFRPRTSAQPPGGREETSQANAPPAANDLSRYERPRDEGDDFRHRMLANVAALAFTVALTAIGIWLAVSIADLRKTQDCVLMGRRDCARISVTPQG